MTGRVLRVAGTTLLLISVAVLAVLAWPRQLGGRFGTTVVVGHSMDGTYATGDLLITRSENAYQRGQVVVYSVTYAEVSGSVVHRIVDEQDGRFTTKGDNNPYPDPWPVTTSDIRGEVVLHLPAVGWAVLVSRTPLVLMLLTGLAVTYLLWPRQDPDDCGNWPAPDGPSYPLTPP